MPSIELATRYRHWCIADSIKQFILTEVPGRDRARLPEEILGMGEVFSSFMRLSVWYSLLYVVVEGYRELGVADDTVDTLLAKESHVEALRRFRNATFHYQKEPFSDKLMEFLVLNDATEWARALNRAFEGFFQRVLPIKEALARLQGHA